VSSRTRKQWVTAFNEAARALLDGPGQPAVPPEYPLEAEPCRRHGEECVSVIHGIIRQHFRWAEHDPDELARTLFRGMVPGTLPEGP
jgi:hypothetical protein